MLCCIMARLPADCCTHITDLSWDLDRELSWEGACCSREEMMSDQEYERAVRVAMTLLRHLHAWGPVHEPAPGSADAGHRLQLPDPYSTTQAVLALLSSLTKRHSIALKVTICSDHS